jgi:hypothetical protein
VTCAKIGTEHCIAPIVSGHSLEADALKEQCSSLLDFYKYFCALKLPFATFVDLSP